MISNPHRLHLEKDILAVMRKGRRYSGEFATLFCLPNRKKISRFGFVVSKKISNKTTRRNQVKRRMRAAASKIRGMTRVGYDCLLIAKPKILGWDYQCTEQEITILFNKAGILLNPKPTP
jgi:ribonuclease P protein component